MKHIAKATLIALSLGTVLMTACAFATAPVEAVAVSLSGEAGEPMKIDIKTPVIKAGTVEFTVKNDAIGTDHEMVLVKLANKDVKISADPKTHRLNEKSLKSLGEVAGLKAGDVGTLKVALAPGEYLLMCNHKAHYELGMATHLTVTN
jgi:uncharacterized cupredoxin-like copper-binding protein